MSSAPRDLGPRADVVVVQIHFELLELLQLRQGGGHAPCAFIAWEAQQSLEAFGSGATESSMVYLLYTK